MTFKKDLNYFKSLYEGKVFPNDYGEFEVLEYINAGNIIVKFVKTGTVRSVRLQHLKNGKVADPMFPSVCGIGYTGGNIENDKARSSWSGMIHRCYDTKANRSRRYFDRGVYVCNEWLNFQNYYRWWSENYVEGYHLDKDILVQGNKCYSENTCCFVPCEVNSLLTYTQAKRGDLPCGVSFNPDRGGVKGNYSAQVCQGKKDSKWLGYFATPEDAFEVYRQAKEEVIRKVAEENFKLGKITEKVYKALLNHKVLPFPE